jgi:leader peptidase (prepilin peptidase)/N-methyltransferase
MGVLFSLLFWKFADNYFLLVTHLIIASILMVALIYDLKHKIIPNILSYLFIFFACLTLFSGGPTLVGVSGVLISLPFWAIVLISKETWMGGGDAKLAMGIGWVLGVAQGISALVLATWIGAIVGIPLLFIQKKGGTMKRIELPFAPFLIVGMYIALFSGIDIWYVNAFL